MSTHYGLACFVAALVAIPLLDPITNALLLLTTFVFAIVSRYSRQYLKGDPRQGYFTIWLCATATCVFGLILAKDLLWFAVAWSLTSLCLHHLLVMYKERTGAILAARKKFLISRLGDVCLIAALFLTNRVYKTWNFDEMFSAASVLRNQSNQMLTEMDAICLFLVMAALLKSAQFPFHSWLPDTMETPTPVSALMHAGIINAGGILVIRFRDLISFSEPAMALLCVAGAVTAVFGSIVMSTQSSIKRYLAFSTVAQMGYMMLECGLGEFHLALVHLMAHSLYKAHAFLSSGSQVQSQSTSSFQSVRAGTLLAASGTAIATVWLAAFLVGGGMSTHMVTKGIFTIALIQFLSGSWNQLESRWLIPSTILLITAVSVGYFYLDQFAGSLTGGTVSHPAWLLWLTLILFSLVALLQTNLAIAQQYEWGRRLYVHARNGFYVNTYSNRFILWITQISPIQLPERKFI